MGNIHRRLSIVVEMKLHTFTMGCSMVRNAELSEGGVELKAACPAKDEDPGRPTRSPDVFHCNDFASSV